MTRFPNYRPSTALREAIVAYREAQAARAVGLGQSEPGKKRQAASAEENALSTPGQSGGPDATSNTSGREGTEIGAADEGDSRGRGGHPDLSDSDALASGRDE